MAINVLAVAIYSDDGWHYEMRQLVHPTWEVIEQAIRRLDRAKYPFVWMYDSAEVDESDQYLFNVIGGAGAYGIDGGENGQYLYYDPIQDGTTIELWTTDQGFETTTNYVCFDVEVVLKIVKYFDETGELDPAYVWKERA